MKFAKMLPALLIATILVAPIYVNAEKGEKKKHGQSEGKHLSKQEKGAADNGKASQKAEPQSKTAAKIQITSQEREIIKSYIKSFEGGTDKKSKSLPPGLQKKVARGGDLPPGWQKKVIVGETMPSEVIKVAVPLPKELVLKLPPPPLGTITVTIDGKVVRLLEKTREIVDILELP